MNSGEVEAIPEPQALTRKNRAATIRILFRPYLSARRPAKKAPTAHPSNILATLKPVPALSELNALCNPSTVPLMTPLSKPNRNPPIVATMLIKAIKTVLLSDFEFNFRSLNYCSCFHSENFFADGFGPSPKLWCKYIVRGIKGATTQFCG